MLAYVLLSVRELVSKFGYEGDNRNIVRVFVDGKKVKDITGAASWRLGTLCVRNGKIRRRSLVSRYDANH